MKLCSFKYFKSITFNHTTSWCQDSTIFFIFVGIIISFLRKLLFTPPGDIHQNAKFEYNLSIISTMFYDVCVSVDNMKIINNFTRNYFTALWCTPSSVQRYHALNVGRIMADKKVLKLRWYNNNQLNLKLFFTAEWRMQLLTRKYCYELFGCVESDTTYNYALQ